MKQNIIVNIAEKRSVIDLGVQGEQQVTRVLFDISSWINAEGTHTKLSFPGKFILKIKSVGDSKIKDVELPRKDNFVVWDIPDAELLNYGTGEVELFYMAFSGQIKASDVFSIIVDACLK